jgi:hypothetical protein
MCLQQLCRVVAAMASAIVLQDVYTIFLTLSSLSLFDVRHSCMYNFYFLFSFLISQSVTSL